MRGLLGTGNPRASAVDRLPGSVATASLRQCGSASVLHIKHFYAGSLRVATAATVSTAAAPAAIHSAPIP